MLLGQVPELSLKILELTKSRGRISICEIQNLQAINDLSPADVLIYQAINTLQMENSQIIIYQTPDGQTSIDVTLDQDTVWLTQSQMVDLFQSSKQNVSLHIRNIFNEGELDKGTTVKESLTVQKEGTRTVKRKVEQYSLDVSTGIMPELTLTCAAFRYFCPSPYLI